MIDFHASEPHYADHLVPIWHALDPAERGRFFHMGRIRDHLLYLGIAADDLAHGRPLGEGLIAVASWQDLLMARQRPAVLLNHGAGQSYGGDPATAHHGSYSGGDGRGNVVLHLCPGEADAQLCRAAQPDVPAVAIGCPKMDRWHRSGNGDYEVRARATIAVGFHSPLKLCPESFWAFPHYERALIDLAGNSDRGFDLIGHGHPRAWPKLRRFYDQVGIEPVEHFGDVLERADVYVADNSSTIFEFASTGRPVVVLNAPWYRRDVHHGLRFWDAADVGPQVDEPEDLAAGIALALENPPWLRDVRSRIVDGIYRHRDGRAAERAVAAIREVVVSEPEVTSRRAAVDPYRARARHRARG